MNMSILSCNLCSIQVDGIAYRTTCRHLLCPNCSRESFEVGCHCPICDKKLTTADVKEIMIGIKGVDFTENTFQYIFQKSNDWIDIIENNQQVALEAANISSFLFTQLGSEVIKANENQRVTQETIHSLKRELEKREESHKRDLEVAKQATFAIQDKLKEEVSEVQRLKEACRDAERKCNAWEKAYGTLREQLRPVNNQNRIVDDPSQALDYTNESHSRTIRRRTEITSISHRIEPVEYNVADVPAVAYHQGLNTEFNQSNDHRRHTNPQHIPQQPYAQSYAQAQPELRNNGSNFLSRLKRASHEQSARDQPFFDSRN